MRSATRRILGIAAAAITVTATAQIPAPAPAVSAELREQLADLVIPRPLSDMDTLDKRAFVCVNVEGLPLSVARLAEYTSGSRRKLGVAADCHCREGAQGQVCARTAAPKQPACSISVFDFSSAAADEAQVSYVVSCGWPRGFGEVSRFERREGRWKYVEAIGRVVL